MLPIIFRGSVTGMWRMHEPRIVERLTVPGKVILSSDLEEPDSVRRADENSVAPVVAFL